MSKLNITNWDDKDLIPEVLGSVFEEFVKISKSLPTSIVITEDQWQKFFYAANEKLTNFRGVPLETPDKTNNLHLVLITINTVLSRMHGARIRDAADVYVLLESMKKEVKEGKYTNV